MITSDLNLGLAEMVVFSDNENNSNENNDNMADGIIDYYPKTDEEKANANGNWWRKWKSGFIEQGGLATPTKETSTIPYHIEFSKKVLNILTQEYSTESILNRQTIVKVATQSLKDFNLRISTAGSSYSIYWEAKGY